MQIVVPGGMSLQKALVKKAGWLSIRIRPICLNLCHNMMSVNSVQDSGVRQFSIPLASAEELNRRVYGLFGVRGDEARIIKGEKM